MDWDKLRVFHAVAEAGSFTHAGDTLNLSQSAVSRQISALEDALQVPLFHRHARGLILTEQGESLNRTVREVFAKLAMTEALLTESKEKPAGRIKVTTTLGFGSSWLAPRLQGFLNAYPEVTMTLLLDDTDLDLAMREADVAIRMHPPKQPDLVQRHLMTIEWHVVASPEYLKKAGTPARPEELDGHKLILFGDYRPPVPDVNWLADAGSAPAGNAARAAGGKQLGRDAADREVRPRDRGGAGLHGGRHGRAGPHAAGDTRAEGGRVLRLSRGVAEFKAGGGVPGFPAVADQRPALTA